MEETTSTHVAEHEAATRRVVVALTAIAPAVVVLDQATKMLIRAWLAEGESWPGRDGLLRLSHVENSGAAFGVLQDGGTLLLAATVIGVVALGAYLILSAASGWLSVGPLALILGGATGNLIDRAIRGTVTDFIDPTRYPAFNVADSAIVIGVAALAWVALRQPDGRDGDGVS
jgi:signal peptidase II